MRTALPTIPIRRTAAWRASGGGLGAIQGAVQPYRRPASIAIHSAFGTQIILGILTVLTGIAIWLAALHQAVGALVVASTVWGAHVLGRTSPLPSAGEGRLAQGASGESS